MSQYNLNAFNRSPYNTQPELNVNWCKASFTERITGAFGSAFENWLSVGFSERVSQSAAITPLRNAKASGTEQVSCSAAVNSLHWMPSMTAEETIAAKVLLSQIVRRPAALQETISCTASIGKDIALQAVFAETITEEVTGGTICSGHAEGYELISAVAGVEAVSEMTGDLQITLQPGQRLIIDAANYNILLDGENMIHTHSGDWLDNLNRDTINIQIQAASGGSGLEASILYTERYL